MKRSDSGTDGEKEKHNKQFDREIKNMISALTRMATEKPGSSRHEEDDEHGVRIITLSGSNVGATMRSEIDDHQLAANDDDDEDEGELGFMTTFVNSNFQTVNNSVMMGSKHETHDPGVHLEICSESDKPPLKTHPNKAKARKDKAAFRNDQRQSEHTD